jgi:hypothetical protein
MDKTIPCDDCGFPICDVEGLDGLYLYPKGYTNNNNTNDAEQDGEEEEEKEYEAVSNHMPPEWFKIQYRNTIFKIGPPQVIITKSGYIIKDENGLLNEYLDEYGLMDEIINFDELKNDELVRLKCISHSAKLEEIFKRKQESKTPQDFKCNECYEMWGCSWCGHGFCDDIMSPYKLEGKPQFWSINDVDPEYWKSKTEKEKRKMIKRCEEQPPILKNFFLCEWCKNEYIDKNISKGRHPKKIGRRLNTF